MNKIGIGSKEKTASKVKANIFPKISFENYDVNLL